jgi:hypothetical protein
MKKNHNLEADYIPTGKELLAVYAIMFGVAVAVVALGLH